MLRRAPTEIELKLDDIDEMINKMEQKAFEMDIELDKSAKSTSQCTVRSRIGAPSPRVRMAQAADTQSSTVSDSG